MSDTIYHMHIRRFNLRNNAAAECSEAFPQLQRETGQGSTKHYERVVIQYVMAPKETSLINEYNMSYFFYIFVILFSTINIRSDARKM